MKVSELKRKIIKGNPEINLNLKKDLSYQVAFRVEQARLTRGYTQEKLANLVNTQQSNIARVERGASLPSLTLLQRIAEAFDTYLIAPKFAFMEELRQVKIDLSSNLTVNNKFTTKGDVISPYSYSTENTTSESILV